MYKNAKWINTSVTLLALLSFAELIFTVTLLLFFNDILYHLGAHLSTVGGFVASLVTLPSSFKIKTSHSSSGFKSHFEDVASYHKFVLFMSFGMQCIACILCVHSFAQISHSTHQFSAIMKHYNKRVENKILVDTVQLLLQCCGTHSYEEWLEHNSDVSCITTESDLLLMPKKQENFYNIPYSCCFLNSKNPCENYDVVNLGTETINKKGCSKQIIAFLLSITLSEITLYAFVATTIGVSLWAINSKDLTSNYEDVSRESKKRFRTSSVDLDFTSTKIKNMLNKKGPPPIKNDNSQNIAKKLDYDNQNKPFTETKKPVTKNDKPFEKKKEMPEEKLLLASPKKRVSFTSKKESGQQSKKTERAGTPSKKNSPKSSTPVKQKKSTVDTKILDPKQSQSTNTIKPKPKNNKMTRVQLFLEEEFSNLRSKTILSTE